MLIYSEKSDFSGGAVDFSRIDATARFLEHYSNYLILTQFALTGSFFERHEAEKELIICKRRMKFWRRQARFDQALATAGATKLKSLWNRSSDSAAA